MATKRKATSPAPTLALTAADQVDNPKRAKPTAEPGAATTTTTQVTPPDWDRLLDGYIYTRAKRWSKVSASKNLDIDYLKVTKNRDASFQFLCICDPTTDYEEEDDDEGDSGDQDDQPRVTCDQGRTCPCSKPATAVPSHPFTMTKAGLAKNGWAQYMMNFRNPDAFNLYTFGDHMSYGALEVVQNMFLDFDEAFRHKTWQTAWAVIEATVMFMLVGGGDIMLVADDPVMVGDTVAQLARMVLTMFSVLEADGHLNHNSPFRNVGWVVALYLKLVATMRSMSYLEESKPTKARAFKFRPNNLDHYLRAYAHCHGITVPGVPNIAEGADLTMPKETVKEPWGWSRTFNEYTKSCVPPMYAYRGAYRRNIGGDALDITTWSPAERKRGSYMQKDPLSEDTLKKLEEGQLFMMT